MGINLSSNIDLQGGLPLDSRYGPYSSTTVANSSIVTANRFVGLTVGIVTGTTTYNGLQLTEAVDGIQDYWYFSGITDADLVLKEGGTGEPGTSGSSGSSGTSGSSGQGGGTNYFFNSDITEVGSYLQLSPTPISSAETTTNVSIPALSTG